MGTKSTNRTQPLPTVYYDIKTGVARINKREIEDFRAKDRTPSETVSALDDLPKFLREAADVLAKKK
ncbi:MAG: hypothetical protein NVSMB56_11230 [Pyrinomonadaceae bacterium]